MSFLLKLDLVWIWRQNTCLCFFASEEEEWTERRIYPAPLGASVRYTKLFVVRHLACDLRERCHRQLTLTWNE
jgi:hypothetical protein